MTDAEFEEKVRQIGTALTGPTIDAAVVAMQQVAAAFSGWSDTIGKLAGMWFGLPARYREPRRRTSAWTRTAATRASVARRRRLPDGRMVRAVRP